MEPLSTKSKAEAQKELLATSFGVDHRGELLAQAGPEPAAVSDVGMELIRGTVKIIAFKDGQPRWSGSGTVVSKDGLVITNAHVAYPVAPGLAVLYVSLRLVQGGAPDALVVAVNESEDTAPIPRYLAELRKVDGYLDVAIIEITTNLDGSPVDKDKLDLPAISLGDSDRLHADGEIRVFGFPAAGDETITVTRGRVSGFTNDPKIPGRGWIKTDALVTQGNSGGLAADADGKIIGVPTQAPSVDQGGLSRVRPVNLIKPMLLTVREEPVVLTTYLTVGSGAENLTLASWLDDPIGGQLPVVDYPEGTTRLSAHMAYRGMTDGEDILTIWTNQLGQFSDLQQDVWSRGPEGDALIVNLYSQQPLEAGQYLLRIFAGPSLQPIGAAATTVGGMLLTGRVRSAADASPIPGAQLVALKPGTDPAAWSAAPVDEAVAAFAIADDDGEFRMSNRIASGQAYPVLVAAAKFQPIQLSLMAPARDLIRDFGLHPAEPEAEAGPAADAQP
jgi:S1-C subfamily serine protease